MTRIAFCQDVLAEYMSFMRMSAVLYGRIMQPGDDTDAFAAWVVAES